MPITRQHHLLRIDNDRTRTHAWRVQVQRRGRIEIKHFSDGVYGGKQAALKAALAWRDARLKELHDRRYGLWRRNRRRRNNTSGMVGVGRYISHERNGRTLTTRESWQAFWNDADGRRRGRKFSVLTHGERKARQLAIEARRQALRVLAKQA